MLGLIRMGGPGKLANVFGGFEVSDTIAMLGRWDHNFSDMKPRPSADRQAYPALQH